MIPVDPQPEPPEFAKRVREKGRAWFENKGISLDKPLTRAQRGALPPLWLAFREALWQSYEGVCPYLSIYFEFAAGMDMDHFLPVSKRPDLAYEWKNYRNACSGVNRQKQNALILDPIGLSPNTFLLNLLDGKIQVNPQLSKEAKRLAQKTLKVLDLNSLNNQRMRAKRWLRYLANRDGLFLKEQSPFIWYEAQRQGLLDPPS